MLAPAPRRGAGCRVTSDARLAELDSQFVFVLGRPRVNLDMPPRQSFTGDVIEGIVHPIGGNPVRSVCCAAGYRVVGILEAMCHQTWYTPMQENAS